MKGLQILFKGTLLTILFTLAKFGFAQSAELIITPTNGKDYVVHITMTPEYVIAQDTCTGGYNYEVSVNYEVELVGPDAPPNLYTLNAYMACDDDTAMFIGLPNIGGSGDTLTGANPWRDKSDCATATPKSLNCNSFEIEISGDGIDHQWIDYTATPLPVELIHFEGRENDFGVELNWATASESNNDFFAVERSLDGVNWENIGRVEGNGTTYQGAEYSFTDFAPVAGTSYYRLKQNDFDGTFDYSDMVVVKRNAGLNNVKVFPNPAQSVVTIEGNGVDVPVITNLAGQEVNNLVQLMESQINSVSVDVSALPNGMYFVHVGTEAYKLYIK